MFSHKWHIRFLELAKHVSTWSKDPSTKVGAIIVDKNKIVRGMGYNSFSRGIKDLPERYEDRELKYDLTVHAELNALLNSNGPLDDCVMYIFPPLMEPNICPNCAKHIAQTGIKMIIGYKSDNLSDRWQKYSEISKLILDEADIKYINLKP